jgi:hypothetical protein
VSSAKTNTSVREQETEMMVNAFAHRNAPGNTSASIHSLKSKSLNHPRFSFWNVEFAVVSFVLGLKREGVVPHRSAKKSMHAVMLLSDIRPSILLNVEYVNARSVGENLCRNIPVNSGASAVLPMARSISIRWVNPEELPGKRY